MCGISGICLRDPLGTVDVDLLRQMTLALWHRGPDGDGFLLRGNVGFGHRRLSIIDLAGGDQPIYNEDRTVGTVFNGEIYNYLELMADLAARGHRFKTKSDTEVIVHLYEEYGERCVDHLRGMFVFAVYDARRSCVFLARDRLGIKPLFYQATDDRFLFASELKALLQDPRISRRVDKAALQSYLAYGYVPGDSCIFAGVAKLPPGHTLTWSDGRIRLRRYWDVSFDVPREPSERDYSGQLLATLQEAVALHLRSDVPVGILLSGGVDSSTVVAMAASQMSAKIKTFSIGFAERDYSELVWARRIADLYKTDHLEIMVRERDISMLPQIVSQLDEPFADPSAFATYFICREAAKHVRVCLTGDGADEVFAGYTRYGHTTAYRYVDRIPRSVRRATSRSVASVIPAAMWGRGLVERIGADGAERYLGLVGVFSMNEAASLVAAEPGFVLTRSLEPYFGVKGRDLVSSMQHADQKTYLPDDILVKVDRMSMQHSLEVRPPFLDHAVVEFGNSCPPGLKRRGADGKYILKHAIREYLPREVLHRRKMGFGIPIKQWFRDGLEGMAEDMLLGTSSRSALLLDRAAVARLLRAHRRGLRDLSRRIWSLVVLEHWCRSYIA